MLECCETILLPEEVCSILRIGQSECYRLLRSGELSGYKVGKTWRIPKENLENYIRRFIQ